MVCYLTQNMETKWFVILKHGNKMVYYLTQTWKQNGLLFNTKHGNKMVCYLTQNMETKWFVI